MLFLSRFSLIYTIVFLPVECISLWLNRGVLFLVKDDENDSMNCDIDPLKGGGFASS